MDDATRRWLLDHLGNATNLIDLEARYTLLGKARAVALSILRQRHADLVNDQPASINVNSVVGVTFTENIKAIERKIAYLESDDAPLAPDEPADISNDSDGQFGVIRLIERRRR